MECCWMSIDDFNLNKKTKPWSQTGTHHINGKLRLAKNFSKCIENQYNILHICGQFKAVKPKKINKNKTELNWTDWFSINARPRKLKLISIVSRFTNFIENNISKSVQFNAEVFHFIITHIYEFGSQCFWFVVGLFYIKFLLFIECLSGYSHELMVKGRKMRRPTEKTHIHTHKTYKPKGNSLFCFVYSLFCIWTVADAFLWSSLTSSVFRSVALISSTESAD